MEPIPSFLRLISSLFHFRLLASAEEKNLAFEQKMMALPDSGGWLQPPQFLCG